MMNSDQWRPQIALAQANQRSQMARAVDPCPECGLCSPEAQATCVREHDCELRRYKQ